MHLSDKEGSGWFPKKQGTRSLCVMCWTTGKKPVLPPIDPTDVDEIV